MTENVRAPTELLELIADSCSVISLLSNITRLIKITTDACAKLGVIDAFPSDNSYKDSVTRWFRRLSQQLEQQNRDLENLIRMEALNVQYGKSIVRIQRAISSSVDIAETADAIERQRYVQIFKDVCAGQKHTLAMDNLIEGLRGTGTFQINIMDRCYTHTNGNLPKLRAIARELLMLVYGGFIAMYTYETLMHDQRFAEALLNKYTDRTKDVQRNIQNIFDRCKNELRENMIKDLIEILDSNDSNTEAVNSLSSLMSEKYDWLENYCIVCNEIFPVDCWFEGNYVHSRGRNSRFGAIFYQDVMTAEVDPGSAAANLDVARILERFTRPYWIIPNAKDMCRQLIETFRSNGIETCGCAVIKPKISLFRRSLYAILPGFLDTIAFQKKGNSLTTVHCCRHGNVLGPKVIHFVIQWKRSTELASSPVNFDISYNLTEDAVIVNEF